jgi:tetratricopeptide (TPR) repeat protein
VETALVTIRLARHLGDAYHPGWVLDLRARAYAYLGNALRVLGELTAADHAFFRAEECLAKSGTGNIRMEAEVLSLKGSLRLDQRCLEQAQELVNRALALYRASHDSSGVARTLVQRVKVVQTKGDLDLAIELLKESGNEIDPHQEPRLFAYARQNLLVCLTRAGRNEEAGQILPEVRIALQPTAEPLDWLRLRWAEASIAQGLGRTDEAEVAYREVQGKFLEMRKSYDAALVSLDLAALLAGQGRTEELKVLAAEILPVFESREVHREAMASLLLFHQACVEERATRELIQQIASALRRDRRGNGGS